MLLLMLATEVAGQGPPPGGGSGECGSFLYCSGNAHAVENQMYDDGEGRHDDCLICQYVESGEPAPIEMCHPACWDSGTEALAYQALLAAAQRGDDRMVYSLAQGAPSFTIFNQERRSIQLLSCDRKSVIGNIPVPDHYVAWLAPRGGAGAFRATMYHWPVTSAYSPTPLRRGRGRLGGGNRQGERSGP